ncbi:MAG TPA: hypothetical protein VIC05_09120 [Solirubrobacteraceae bacterium]|jgi:hypothetical protein
MKRFVALGGLLIGGSLLAAPTAGATLVCPPGVTNPAYCQNITPPSVTTGLPVPAPPSGATLTGTVNPNGAATTYVFQYGTTTSYGSSTAAGSLAASSSNQNVQQNITGLTTGTTYHYRLVAKNPGGETVGADQMFTLCKNGISPGEFCAAPGSEETHIIIHGHATSKGKGFVLIELTCTKGSPCEGTLYLLPPNGSSSRAHTSAATVYGSATYSIAANSTGNVQVELTEAGKAALAKTGKLTASAVTVSGGVRTVIGKITVKGKKHKKAHKKAAHHVTHATRSPGFTG